MHTETNGKTMASLVIQIIGIVIIVGGVVASVATPIILMYAKINTLETKLEEIETQFHSADEVRNIQYASTLRFTSLLWTKSYGEPFPSEVYFPHVTKH